MRRIASSERARRELPTLLCQGSWIYRQLRLCFCHDLRQLSWSQGRDFSDPLALRAGMELSMRLGPGRPSPAAPIAAAPHPEVGLASQARFSTVTNLLINLGILGNSMYRQDSGKNSDNHPHLLFTRGAQCWMLLSGPDCRAEEHRGRCECHGQSDAGGDSGHSAKGGE